MRRPFFLTLSLVFAVSMWPGAGAALAADPAVPAQSPAHAARQTWEQHFAAANVAHDGHLTPEEAKTGFPLVAKNFQDIDADNKGYVTQNDIRAWRIMKKAAHRLTRPPEEKLKPSNAMQLVPLRQVAISPGA